MHGAVVPLSVHKPFPITIVHALGTVRAEDQLAHVSCDKSGMLCRQSSNK